MYSRNIEEDLKKFPRTLFLHGLPNNFYSGHPDYTVAAYHVVVVLRTVGFLLALVYLPVSCVHGRYVLEHMESAQLMGFVLVHRVAYELDREHFG